jgi:hypothetical protein
MHTSTGGDTSVGHPDIVVPSRKHLVEWPFRSDIQPAGGSASGGDTGTGTIVCDDQCSEETRLPRDHRYPVLSMEFEAREGSHLASLVVHRRQSEPDRNPGEILVTDGGT